MPWKVNPVTEQRIALVGAVRTLGVPVSRAAREFGVARKTAYKWLARSAEQPGACLEDRPRRPSTSPGQTPPELERRIVEIRRRFGWGARKIRADLIASGVSVPSIRTVHAVLRRHGCIAPPKDQPAEVQRFERTRPNELWQIDFKGPIELGRRRYEPFTVLDDHSRYLLAFTPCPDRTMDTAWSVLWEVFGEAGLPEAVLSDNAFSTQFAAPRTLSRFDSRLVRLGIKPLHGRPYHPQTQGKVERLHGTVERELYPRARRDSLAGFTDDLGSWRRLYNDRRPHEALGDAPPLSRWRPSVRPRPEVLPPIEYPSGAVLRKVSSVGDIRWKTCRILAGRGLVGELVAVEEQEHELLVRYGNHEIRRIHTRQLQPGTML